MFQEAECEKLRMDSKFEADTKIADSARAYQMQKASFDMEVNRGVGRLYVVELVHSRYVQYAVEIFVVQLIAVTDFTVH